MFAMKSGELILGVKLLNRKCQIFLKSYGSKLEATFLEENN